jgi:hypothetical protein
MMLRDRIVVLQSNVKAYIGRSGEDEDDMRPLALNIFKYVQRLTNAKEKAVRQRACELLREVFCML